MKRLLFYDRSSAHFSIDSELASAAMYGEGLVIVVPILDRHYIQAAVQRLYDRGELQRWAAGDFGNPSGALLLSNEPPAAATFEAIERHWNCLLPQSYKVFMLLDAAVRGSSGKIS